MTRNARDVLRDIASHQQRSTERAKALGTRKQWWRVENATTTTAGKTRAKIYLYEPIGGWPGVTPKGFVDELNDLDVDEIELHVNSPGGSVYDGIAIMNALRQHDAYVIGVVDGLAASAASFIAVGGCNELAMAEHSELFLHDAWGLCVGNAEDMTTMAADLDRVSDNLAAIYARKAGGTAESWRDVLRAEKWYSAQEAVTAGLADRVGLDEDTEDDAADASNRWDRGIFASLATDPAPGGTHPHKPPTASAARVTSPAAPASGDTTTQEGADVIFNDAQLTSLRQNLGVADDADGDIIVAALQEALQEQATDERPAAGPTTVPEGMVLMDAGTAASLREDAQAGREARNQQLADHRHNLVDAAVRDGRILRAKAAGWEKTLAADPSMEDTLANLEKGLVPIDEVGHAGEGPQSSDAHNDLYAQFWGSEGSNEKKEA